MTDTADPAAIYARLKSSTAALLQLKLDDLSPAEALKLDLTVLLRLQLDSLTAAALAGRTIDTSQLSACTSMLSKLVPAAATSANTEPDFSGSLEMFARIVQGQHDALEAREVHLSTMLEAEVANLKIEISKLHDQLADAKYLDTRPTIPATPEPQRSSQPPKPSPPAHYLRGPDEPWRPFWREQR